jgi:hypothetical protein
MTREPPWSVWRSVVPVQVALTGGMAVATLLAPRPLLRLFGVEPTSGAVLFMRAFGAGLAFTSVIHQGPEVKTDARAARTVMLANLAEDALLAVLSASALARGGLGKAGWVLVGVFASEVALNAWLAARFAPAAAAGASDSEAAGAA